MNTAHFAEIIESQLDHYTAQCWQWDNFPSFGSLVCVEEETRTVLGVVTTIATGSIDPTRTPYPYQKTEAELRAEQPQIFEFLRTIFTVAIVGYRTHTPTTKLYYHLPPTPRKIHAFVGNADSSLASQFFAQPDYLHLLFTCTQTLSNIDELLLAIIHQHYLNGDLKQANIDAFCNTFALLTGNDYRRLKLFLKRIEVAI
ncbi:MAG: HAS-barrel domain-containing protein [Candidatus Babeliales bacterium]|jgi:hypothetical protein